MKLPGIEGAIITRSKIVLYLLNDTHKEGKTKAKYFKSYGFTPEQWESFAQALYRHAAEYDVVTILDTETSIQYTIEGTLITPDGYNPFVRTVWATDHGDDFPHLVTAYPVDKR